MADTKISALTAASAALGTQEIPVNEGGTSKKLTVTQIKTFANPAEFSTAVAIVTTSESTTSTGFTDLTTPGPAVTVTVGASGKVKVTLSCQFDPSSSYMRMAVALSGANTVAAPAGNAILIATPGSAYIRVSKVAILTGLAAGSTTFTVKYNTGSGTGTFELREIIVEPVL